METKLEEEALKDIRGLIGAKERAKRILIPLFETEIPDLYEIIEGIADEEFGGQEELENLINGLTTKEGDKIWVSDITSKVPLTVAQEGRFEVYLVIEDEGCVRWYYTPQGWGERELISRRVDMEGLDVCPKCGELKNEENDIFCVCTELDTEGNYDTHKGWRDYEKLKVRDLYEKKR